MHTHTHTCTHIRTHIYTYTHKYTCTHTSTHVYTHIPQGGCRRFEHNRRATDTNAYYNHITGYHSYLQVQF